MMRSGRLGYVDLVCDGVTDSRGFFGTRMVIHHFVKSCPTGQPVPPAASDFVCFRHSFVKVWLPLRTEPKSRREVAQLLIHIHVFCGRIWA